MQLINVTLTDLQRRNRTAFAVGSVLGQVGDLAEGEQVVLRDTAGEYFAGRVVDVSSRDGDVYYLFRVGVRLTEEYAYLRMVSADPELREESGVNVQGVLDLLDEAREAYSARVSEQRRAHGHPTPSLSSTTAD